MYLKLTNLYTRSFIGVSSHRRLFHRPLLCLFKGLFKPIAKNSQALHNWPLHKESTSGFHTQMVSYAKLCPFHGAIIFCAFVHLRVSYGRQLSTSQMLLWFSVSQQAFCLDGLWLEGWLWKCSNLYKISQCCPDLFQHSERWEHTNVTPSIFQGILWLEFCRTLRRPPCDIGSDANH